MKIEARSYHCELCHKQVIICTYCDRGNVYCELCVRVARQKRQRQANRKYQKTLKGRTNNATRQSRLRLKNRQKGTERSTKEKKVTDRGSSITLLSTSCNTERNKGIKPNDGNKKITQPCCDFCGREVIFKQYVSVIPQNVAKIIRGSLFPQGA